MSEVRTRVEAVAIMRRLLEDPLDPEARKAAEIWLEENHPSPADYVRAFSEAALGDS